MITYEAFKDNCKKIEEKVNRACEKVGRCPTEVSILPVTKYFNKDAIEYAKSYGFRAIAENKVQDAIQKKAELGNIDIRWELIGHLQSNKAKVAVDAFECIQTIDSLKLISKINNCALEANKVQNILIQINIDNDEAKFGIPKDRAYELIEHVIELSNIKLSGLMTIPRKSPDLKDTQKAFKDLRALKEAVESKYNITLPQLSMGMSLDFAQAIEEGSTQIRIGSALFREL